MARNGYGTALKAKRNEEKEGGTCSESTILRHAYWACLLRFRRKFTDAINEAAPDYLALAAQYPRRAPIAMASDLLAEFRQSLGFCRNAGWFLEEVMRCVQETIKLVPILPLTKRSCLKSSVPSGDAF